MINLNELEFRKIVLDILNQSNNSITEHLLLKKLDFENQISDFSYNDSLSLFHIHFILFYNLYRLRDQLLLEKKGIIEIKSILITLKPYEEGKFGICEVDPLAEYYKNLNNLNNTTEEDIENLLNQFWTKFEVFDYKKKALETLMLQEPVNFIKIKKQYRSLVSIHHPDCGGNKNKMQEINEAMDILKKIYT